MDNELRDEILEMLWTMRERGSRKYAHLVDAINNSDVSEVIHKMEKSNLLTISGEDVSLAEKGEERARDLIRRHRLAERLFHDVLDVSMKESEETACEIEHFLSPSVTDSVCSFLGHPPTCPHGKPIPRGHCCSKYRAEVKPLVMKMKELETGALGRIVFIVPSDSSRLERLASMGLIPGSIIRLKQKRPSFILEVDQTTLAIDSLIADEIYVKNV